MKIVLMEPLGITKEALNDLSSVLTKSGHDFIAYDTKEENQEKLIERVKEAEIIMLANQPLSAAVIEKCPKLKMISIAFTGVDHVAADECKKRNIVLSNAAGYSTNAVAELVFGLIISVYRYINQCNDVVRKGGTKGNFIGNEICGKKLGIVGTGAIGLKVAAIAKAFGCEIIAYSRSKRNEGNNIGIKYVSLEEVMSESDIVTLHLPLNSETKNIIDSEKLSLMKKSAIIINTARGGVIDNTALAEALKNGKIAGAGIDVFDMEPPIPENYPLLLAPNTVLTPHVAFATKESLYKRAIITFENVTCYIEGKPKNLV